FSKYTLILLLLIIVGTALFYSRSIFSGQLHLPSTAPAMDRTTATNGADNWSGDSESTLPNFDFSSSPSQKLNVSPLFKAYYAAQNGTENLGKPVTVAFPTGQGWIQFFEMGALFLPAVQQQHFHSANDPLVALIINGVSDPDSSIVRLPLLQALLTVGSQMLVGGLGSSLTYVDLRKAANPDHMLPTPTTTPSHTEDPPIFVKAGTRGSKDVGHLIPQTFWNYMQRPDIAPDGWQTDFGLPLTEALAFTIAKNGTTHHLLVQAFWRDGLVLDQDTLDASGQPEVQRLNTGIDYLDTLGPPTVVLSTQHTIWSEGNTALLNAPATGQAVAHIGQFFPLTPSGDTAWNNGMLWYHVQWNVPKHTGSGWVQATAITFTSPGNVPAQASFDVLSPGLAAYLASIGNNIGVTVYDVTRQRYYTYNAGTQFITGSSIKVPIMLTFLDMIERQGREPDANEMNLLTTMIENSNNDSAEILYHDEDGDADGVASYMHRIGVSGLSPYPFAFGWSLITPTTMVNLLTHLYNGTILTAQHRHLALYLMEHIESDQQIGVGDTAPAGAVTAMKDGWVPAPDGLWAMNSSGIVVKGQETYIISVYSRDQNSLGAEYAIVQHVCGAVASLLT
ncbi:MAG TPA: serine hydrolase, partial [Ktedonobacteraceae bacterium]|nr:serine hydrolase [Ktedonobacteraceae bacterium]